MLTEQQARHMQSCITQAEIATKSALRSKVLPKIRDARLYINRPNPNLEQVLRLLEEIEQVVKD